MIEPLILVTNDDGIHAPFLGALATGLEELGEVCVYAPESQQSAVGHGVSLHRPLRVTRLRDRWFMVDGTPTDCVMLAVRDLLDRRPDVVVSGINPGPNLGDDVTYSGTVAGAYEGMLLRLSSFAISMVNPESSHVETGVAFARKLVRHLLEHDLPADTVLNVNVPDVPPDAIQGVSITRMGRRDYKDEIIRRVDPRGQTYYWIGGADPSHVAEPGTDFEAIEHDRISVTPLYRDLTNHTAIRELQDWGIEA
ncbi:MAG TPA: 5'/3'-nucleotidase SurE [Candidatus Hydrogenedentes bacterium]|nr:5'/3'-nucleotidase SurE [Candidatus Hydrogenedentota bacterium]